MTGHRHLDVITVVPAHNEQRRIGRSLAALDVAAANYPGPVRIVVVDDASTDRTSSVVQGLAAEAQASIDLIRVDVRNAATARALGIRHAVAPTLSPPHTLVCSTDADTTVPDDWFSRLAAHFHNGAPAVAGVVELARDEDAVDLYDRWRDDYHSTFRNDGTHPHVHAANLAVRLDHYLAVGGFHPVERAEDIDLWRRLSAHGLRPVADASIVVTTSARPHGRVRDGFAAALNRLYRTPAQTCEQP